MYCRAGVIAHSLIPYIVHKLCMSWSGKTTFIKRARVLSIVHTYKPSYSNLIPSHYIALGPAVHLLFASQSERAGSTSTSSGSGQLVRMGMGYILACIHVNPSLAWGHTGPFSLCEGCGLTRLRSPLHAQAQFPNIRLHYWPVDIYKVL